MITIVLEPDTSSIHNFSHGTVLPNESFQMTGMVEIQAIRPVHIKRLHIGFHGRVQTVLSTTDLHDSLTMGDEVPMDRWNTNMPTKFMDKLTRGVLGQTQVHYTLVDESVVILESQCLPMGKTRLPFSLNIKNIHCLPPSLFLPHHVIRYTLWASLKLEKLKLSLTKTKYKTEMPIIMYNHTYPSLNLLDLSRIRYRGSRKDCLMYEISMPKFTCLQSTRHPFTCQFNLIRRDTLIESIEFYLEQTELYPIRAGNYNTMYQVHEDTLIARHRKFSRTKHDMHTYENGKELELSLSFNLPHISPYIDTSTLKIRHQLQVLIRFNNKKEKQMSLSFPLTIGTVPMEVMVTTVQPSPNQWLAPVVHDELPTYLDVLTEGHPPSPFLEDI
ncbi:uncharacterized protein EV154DRAFT_115294 [Mucor mucedo]|uniref:uncharacterized protein n=1 Tax=Mucor mucedo TaxID=29922 RepID=UPI002220991D|nr:uncharacterized protein EV154DRAFT_115294 [Mucor mucedo]KAI7897046.1 hypothetical protein EV154DRAFT_115294 [Mucor mucedo]